MAACPYCLTEIEPGGSEAYWCPECGTPTHKECWAENGGCTVFGCPQAPADEEKVTIGAGDLERVRTAGVSAQDAPYFLPGSASGVTPPPAPRGAAPPPPPFPVGGVAPPPFPDGRIQPPMPPVAAELHPVSLNGSLSITAPAFTPHAPVFGPAKSRVMFILLGIFFGIFGAHNFYAGYHKRGGAQLALTCISLFTLAVVTWIWAIVEVCVVSADSENVNMQ